MRVDLSRSIHEALCTSERRAAELRASGDLARSAQVYREAAKLAAQYAHYATGDAERARRLKRSRELREWAERLDRGEEAPVPARLVGGAQAKDHEEGAQPDELRERVTGLIAKADVTWDEIGGLGEAKRQVRLAFGLAVARKPTGVRIEAAPNILLYGPPGTGKSLLAAAISNGLDATFFDVRVSSLLSKWFGESPRLVSTLYATARELSPSVVFFDELEALFPTREAATSGPERRVLSTLLAEMSGVATAGGKEQVFTIGATNAPWFMDEAALSRFGRRVYVPLPDAAARRAIFEVHLLRRGHELSFPMDRLVEASEGLSGRQVAHVAARAVEAMVAEANPDLAQLAGGRRTALARYELKTRPLEWRHFEPALAVTRPDTSPQTVRKFENW